MRIAVVGAGLAGMSAAYYLRKKADVIVFEASERAGGRIQTSRRPYGEHGAEFLLKSEEEICGLLKALRIKRSPVISAWPGYFVRGHLALGEPNRTIIQKVLPLSSVDRVIGLFELVKRGLWPKKHQPADRWLSRFLSYDERALQFVSMLLAGETCAPLGHLCAKYVLECLWSFLDDDEWYRIRGGSGRLINVLSQKSKTTIKLKSQVKEIKPVFGRVRVKWVESEKRKDDIFDGVIITTPQGERLVGRRTQGHFHAYISILLEYRVRTQVKRRPKFDLARGLYTDGPLNYLQLTKRGASSHVLRILLPNAESKRRWRERQILAFCRKHLRRILINPGRIRSSSVKRWKLGLPCGGSKESFRKISDRIYLAGDRFGKWPSMDAAITSGYAAAKALGQVLKQ